MLIIVRERSDHRAVVLEIFGELDSQAKDELAEGLGRVLGDEDRRAVLDLSGVTQMGSQAIGILMIQAKRVRERRGEIRLCGLKPVIEQTLHLAGIHRLMPIHQGLDEALGALGR